MCYNMQSIVYYDGKKIHNCRECPLNEVAFERSIEKDLDIYRYCNYKDIEAFKKRLVGERRKIENDKIIPDWCGLQTKITT